MNKRVLKTAIIISWVVLAVCFIIKILGGNIFNIATTNETFIKVCAFVDNHLWVQNIIAFISNFFIASLINLAVLRQKFFKRKQAIFVLICSIIAFCILIIKDYIENEIIDIIGFILSILPLCICPMILSKKPIRSIFAFILYAIFQSVSIIVKGLSISQINDDSTLVGLIFSVDIYIMLILYYLYANKKDKKDNKNIENKISEKGDNENG